MRLVRATENRRGQTEADVEMRMQCGVSARALFNENILAW